MTRPQTPPPLACRFGLTNEITHAITVHVRPVYHSATTNTEVPFPLWTRPTAGKIFAAGGVSANTAGSASASTGAVEVSAIAAHKNVHAILMSVQPDPLLLSE